MVLAFSTLAKMSAVPLPASSPLNAPSEQSERAIYVSVAQFFQCTTAHRLCMKTCRGGPGGRGNCPKLSWTRKAIRNLRLPGQHSNVKYRDGTQNNIAGTMQSVLARTGMAGLRSALVQGGRSQAARSSMRVPILAQRGAQAGFGSTSAPKGLPKGMAPSSKPKTPDSARTLLCPC